MRSLRPAIFAWLLQPRAVALLNTSFIYEILMQFAAARAAAAVVHYHAIVGESKEKRGRLKSERNHFYTPKKGVNAAMMGQLSEAEGEPRATSHFTTNQGGRFCMTIQCCLFTPNWLKALTCSSTLIYFIGVHKTSGGTRAEWVSSKRVEFMARN